jgi:hypothetical protein
MTTGYNIREGSAMIVERMGEFAGYGVFDALGECYALRDTEAEAHRARVDGELYLHEAARCGHPAAARWAHQRLPISIRQVTVSERAAALEDGVPVLDREGS